MFSLLLRRSDRRGCNCRHGHGDAARATARTRGELFHRRRPRLGRLRGPRDRLLGPARLHHLPRASRATTSRGPGAETEALIVAQQVETAQLLPDRRSPPADRRARLLRALGRPRRSGPDGGTAPRRATDQPVGRSAVRDPAGRATCHAPRSSPRTTSGSIRPPTREEARRDRIHGAEGVIPTPLWIVLFFISGVDLRVHALLRRQRRTGEDAGDADGLGDRRDRRSCCSCSMFLDSPFRWRRGLRPTAMERSLRIIDQELGALGVSGQGLRIPCDARRAAAVSRERRSAQVDWVDIVATVLLALATVATAWSGYQATRWNGEQAKAARPCERGPDRVAARGGTRQRPDAGRRRDVHPVGRRIRARGRRELTDFYYRPVPRGVQARGRGLGRDEAADATAPRR